MLTVYFVDDDSLIIEEMNKIIDWNRFGFEVVGSSTDSVVALKEINECKPDLIFSDIQMDEMSGLQMVSQIEYPANVVFFSAYDRFEYAVDAIKLKALNFLKKPPKKAELIQIVTDVRKKENDKFNEKVFRLTSRSDLNNEAKRELELLLESSRLLPKTDYRVVAVYGDSVPQEFVRKLSECADYLHTLYEDENLYLAIAYALDVSSLRQSDTLNGSNVAVSGNLSGYKGFYDIFKKVRVNSKMYFFNRKNTFVQVDKFNSSAKEIIKELSACGSLTDFQAAVHSLYDKLDGKVLCSDVQRIYVTLVSGLYKFGVIDNAGELLSASALDVYDDYAGMLDDICSYFVVDEDSGFAESVINAIVDEMKKNVGARMSLSSFAKEYGYNTAYLSVVFKKTTGTSFLNYLTELKMDYAKTLMITHPKMPLKNIANEVGYYDYYHFSKMFKKFVGCSPTDFREDIK